MQHANIQSLSELKTLTMDLPPSAANVLKHLIEDERVTSAVDARFAQSEAVHSVTEADVLDEMGLLKTQFLFMGKNGDLSNKGIMVLSDSSGRVAAVLEDLDPVQPEHLVDLGSSHARSSTVPFLLRRETTFVPRGEYPRRHKRHLDAVERFKAKHGLDTMASTSCPRSTTEYTGSAPTNGHTDDRRQSRSDTEYYTDDC